MKQRLAVVLSAIALLVAVLGSTPLGHAVVAAVPPFATHARTADYATNAGAVNGLKASKRPRAGWLLALGQNGRFPPSVGVAGPAGPQGPKGAIGPTGPRGPGWKIDYSSELIGPFTGVHDISFASSGGRLLVFLNGSAYGSAAGQVLNLCLQFDTNGPTAGCALVAENEALSHKALVSVPYQLDLPAGPHTFSLVDESGTTKSDIYDVYSVLILELAPS